MLIKSFSKEISLILNLLLLPFFVFSQQNPALKKVIDNLIRHETDIKKNKVTGYIIGIVEGDSTYFYSYGSITQSSNLAPTPNTIFEIGSATKVFTMSLLNILMDKGELNLEQRVNDLLPTNWRNPKADSLTLRHLVTHTSGLPLYPFGLGAGQLSTRNPYSDYTKEDLLAFYQKYEFPKDDWREKKQRKKKISTPYRYSHVNFALLEVIIELQTKTPFEQLLQQYLLDPLALNDTHISPTRMQLQNTAKAYSLSGLPVDYWTYQSFAGSMGIRSSANDLVRFLKVQMGLLQKDYGNLFSQNFEPRVQTDLNKAIKVGNAWHVIEHKDYFQAIGHPGATDGHRVDMHFIPETKTAVVVLSNSAYHMDNLGLMILRAMNNAWRK